ncbi:MAG TPA: hypothetical protein ENI90_06410 [Methylothermaceae bacterium]|nr:hypothetical protein [Methylothermaceae bacterium]
MRVIALSLLFLWLAGCASLSTFEQPRVTVTDIRLRGGGMLAQEFLVTLRVDNPNAYGFKINGAVSDILLNGQPIARGLSNQPIEIPAYGSAEVDIVALVKTLGLLQQLMELGTRQAINYEVTGHLNVARGWNRNLRIPFRERGSLDFWRFIGEQAIPRPLTE